MSDNKLLTTDELRAVVKDLHRQATEEHSHYYCASVLERVLVYLEQPFKCELRDQFAGQAFQALLFKMGGFTQIDVARNSMEVKTYAIEHQSEYFARRSYELADEMIKQREK